MLDLAICLPAGDLVLLFIHVLLNPGDHLFDRLLDAFLPALNLGSQLLEPLAENVLTLADHSPDVGPCISNPFVNHVQSNSQCVTEFITQSTHDFSFEARTVNCGFCKSA
jgi:hypothetical protein